MLDARDSAIRGHPESDLDNVFAPRLPGLDQERDWCEGHCWLGDESVRSPWHRAVVRRPRVLLNCCVGEEDTVSRLLRPATA